MEPAADRPRSAIRPPAGRRLTLSAARWLHATFPSRAVIRWCVALFLLSCAAIPPVSAIEPTFADQSPAPPGLPDAIEQAVAAVQAEVAADTGDENAADPIHDAVVRIIALTPDGLKLGSGSLVAISKDYGLVLTNWHVVGSVNDEILVAFSGGYRSTAKILKTDSMWDLAALAIDRPPVAPLRIARRIPTPGDPLRIAGYGDGPYRCVSGLCTQFVGPAPDQPFQMVELSVVARHGDSGGPILNASGEIAGVLFGAADGCTTGSDCGRVAVFLKDVMAEFNALPARPLTQVATAGVAAQPKPKPEPTSHQSPQPTEPEAATDVSPSPPEPTPAVPPVPETVSTPPAGSEKSPPEKPGISPFPSTQPGGEGASRRLPAPGPAASDALSRLSPEEDEVGTPLWRQSLRRFLNRPIGTVCWDLLAILGILTMVRAAVRMVIRDRRRRRRRSPDTPPIE